MKQKCNEIRFMLLCFWIHLNITDSKNLVITCFHDNNKTWTQFQCIALPLSNSSVFVSKATNVNSSGSSNVKLFDHMRRCTVLSNCQNGWGNWIILQRCKPFCNEDEVLRKRSCRQSELNSAISDCPFRQRSRSCRNKICYNPNIKSLKNKRASVPQSLIKKRLINQSENFKKFNFLLLKNLIKFYIEKAREFNANWMRSNEKYKNQFLEHNRLKTSETLSSDENEVEDYDESVLSDDTLGLKAHVKHNSPESTQNNNNKNNNNNNNNGGQSVFCFTLILALAIIGGIGWVGFWICCVYNLSTRSSLEKRSKIKRSDIDSFYENAGTALPPSRMQSFEIQNFHGNDITSNTMFPTKEQLLSWRQSSTDHNVSDNRFNAPLSGEINREFETKHPLYSSAYPTTSCPSNSCFIAVDFPQTSLINHEVENLNFTFDGVADRNESDTESEVFKSEAIES